MASSEYSEGQSTNSLPGRVVGEGQRRAESEGVKGASPCYSSKASFEFTQLEVRRLFEIAAKENRSVFGRATTRSRPRVKG